MLLKLLLLKRLLLGLLRLRPCRCWCRWLGRCLRTCCLEVSLKSGYDIKCHGQLAPGDESLVRMVGIAHLGMCQRLPQVGLVQALVVYIKVIRLYDWQSGWEVGPL